MQAERITHLQKADHQTNDRITPQPARVNLIHRPLTQKRLDHQDELSSARQYVEVLVDDLSSRNTVCLVERYINVDLA